MARPRSWLQPCEERSVASPDRGSYSPSHGHRSVTTLRKTSRMALSPCSPPLPISDRISLAPSLDPIVKVMVRDSAGREAVGPTSTPIGTTHRCSGSTRGSAHSERSSAPRETAELSPPTFCTFRRELSSLRQTRSWEGPHRSADFLRWAAQPQATTTIPLLLLRLSSRKLDPRMLPVEPETKPREPGATSRTSKRAELCPGSGWLPDSSPGRLNDENSRGKVQNVREDSRAGKKR